MAKMLVVYTSSFGNTKKMAESVRDGAMSVPGAEVRLLEAEHAGLNDARAADGIIVGSPVRHRSADARVKAFVERAFEVGWLADELVGKVGGVFTVGGAYGNCGAGCEITQIALLSAMAACGMLLVPFPKTTPGSTEAGHALGTERTLGRADDGTGRRDRANARGRLPPWRERVPCDRCGTWSVALRDGQRIPFAGAAGDVRYGRHVNPLPTR